MLFSFLMGIAAVGYFLFRTALVKAKLFFSVGRTSAASQTRHKFVVYNEGNQYWNVFKPILDEFERRGIAVRYLTSAENDPFFAQNYARISGEFIGVDNKAFARLNLLEADVCLMTTPGLDVYQLKRSKGVRHYAHILHDVGDAVCYRLFGLDWFDSVLLSGEYQKADIRELERQRGIKAKELEVVGSAYLDVFQEKLAALPKEEKRPFTVLVSPSWGKGSLLNVFGERLLDPLIATGWRVIVRPHPQSKKSEPKMLKRLEERYKDAVEWDYSPENLETLSKSDAMLSDFSSVIFDFAFLFDRPVIYADAFFNRAMYDAGDIEHELWRFEAVRSFGVELKEAELPRIKKIVEEAVADEKKSSARKTAKETAWRHIGECGARVVDFLTRVGESETPVVSNASYLHENQK
jgi:hypothetical protein